MITVEYYFGPMGVRLAGAVNVPARSMREHARKVGKLICQIHHENEMEAVLIDENGDEIERLTVYR